MNKPAELICTWCGKVNREISFLIGACKCRNQWTMHEGTGKISCNNPACYQKGSEEAQAAIAAHIRSLNAANGLPKAEQKVNIDTTRNESSFLTEGLRLLP